MNKNQYMRNILIIVMFLFVVIHMDLPFVYQLNDDVMMRSIVSGSYLGNVDSHLIYMGYPLSGFIGFFYKILPNIPWFDLFMVGITTICFGLISNKIVDLFHSKKSKVITSLIVILCFIIYYYEKYILITYTEVAALVFGTGLFLFCMNEKQDTVKSFIKQNQIVLVLLLISFMIRDQVFYMCLPYLGVVVLWKILELYLHQVNNKINIKSIYHYKKWLLSVIKPYIYYMLILMLGIGISIAIGSVMYQSEEWKQYKEYDEVRTDLYDFTGIPEFAENQDLYLSLGFTENDYHILEQYNILLKDYYTKDNLQSLVDEADAMKLNTSFSIRLKAGVIEYVYRTFNQLDWPMNYIAIALYLLVVVVSIYHKKIINLLMILLLGSGRTVIWLYFIMAGRYPDRITFSLYLIEFLLLIAILLRQLKIYLSSTRSIDHYKIANINSSKKRIVNKRNILHLSTIIIIIGLGVWGLQTILLANQLANAKIDTNKEWKALQEYCEKEPENFYFIDVYSMVQYSGDLFDENLEYENYTILGGWMTETPLLEEKLEQGKTKKHYYIARIGSEIEEMMQLEKVDVITYNGKELFYVYEEGKSEKNE